MKIKIGNKNKIKDSNIGCDNKIENTNKENSKKFNFWTMVFIPIVVAVIAGIIIWLITENV